MIRLDLSFNISYNDMIYNLFILLWHVKDLPKVELEWQQARI